MNISLFGTTFKHMIKVKYVFKYCPEKVLYRYLSSNFRCIKYDDILSAPHNNVCWPDPAISMGFSLGKN